MNPEEYQNRLARVLAGLQDHLSAETAQRFVEKITHDVRLFGDADEWVIEERVLWKLEEKLDRLIEEEMT
ncbi:MAG: hypothetical protein P4M11_11575 [Candidatus Pacebacteria bacterium]|nr:hypothetical protein [Candidatus Paceibacterota bacterium]